MLNDLIRRLLVPTGNSAIQPPPWTMVPYAGIPPADLAVSQDANAEIRRLEQEIARLERMGAFGGTSAQRARTRLAELRGAQGVTPPPAAAPTFGARIETPRVGVDALKIMLPS